MKLPTRASVLFFIGLFAVGSTALGYYYYFVYSPPLETAESFMKAMEEGDAEALKKVIIMGADADADELREPNDEEVQALLAAPFERGRILDQRKREGGARDYYYLVYREPDAAVYALLVTRVGDEFRLVIPERPARPGKGYLWDYTWTN